MRVIITTVATQKASLHFILIPHFISLLILSISDRPCLSIINGSNMAQESPSLAPPPPMEDSIEKGVALPPPSQDSNSNPNSNSLAAMMERDGTQSSSPDLVTESMGAKEEVVSVEANKNKQIVVENQEKKQKLPQSLVSFKEESNIVADLSDSERQALQELRNIVQEALNTHQFTKETPAVGSGHPPTEKSDVSGKKSEESKIEETPQKEPQQESSNEPNIGSLVPKLEPLAVSEEVSIWGVPLLKDDRSDVILLKFLRARDFNVKEAYVMIKSTIHWRRDFKIDELVEEDLGEDLEKVVFVHGHDSEGHPVCYNVYGELQNKTLYEKTFSDEEKRTRFLRWRIQFLEKSVRKLDFSPGGVSTIFQVNDLQNAPGPGKRELRLVTKQALQLLQDNYPEFVAKQVFINVPWWYVAFYTLINPFLTQRTKSKFVFAGQSKTVETLFKYISPEQVPIKYGGLSVDYCDCNLEFTVDDPATEITVKPGTKQIVEIIVYERCLLVWEIRVLGWEVTYGAEFVPDAKDAYTVIIQKPSKMAPTDGPVVTHGFKVAELGKILLTIDNPTSKKKKLLYRFKIKPLPE